MTEKGTSCKLDNGQFAVVGGQGQLWIFRAGQHRMTLALPSRMELTPLSLYDPLLLVVVFACFSRRILWSVSTKYNQCCSFTEQGRGLEKLHGGPTANRHSSTQTLGRQFSSMPSHMWPLHAVHTTLASWNRKIFTTWPTRLLEPWLVSLVCLLPQILPEFMSSLKTAPAHLRKLTCTFGIEFGEGGGMTPIRLRAKTSVRCGGTCEEEWGWILQHIPYLNTRKC